jgi:outer membrane protein OmpA-like peptidoglycan-associated protein
MVLALVIAATSKGCGDSESSSPAAQSPTTSTGTGAAAGVEVIDQINNEIAQSGIVFVTGEADLAPASRTTLDRIAAILAANAAVKAEVRGHTDSQGDAQKNLDLSQQRAQAVVDYLAQKGIVAARLTAKGLGETVPIADNNTEAGRAKNRRVEFAIAP